MIFVTVGASQFPFDRLLHAVDDLRLEEEIIVQHGPSTVRPSAARCISFLPFTELTALARDARVVISHAGIGSVLVAASAGKRPVVVPRRRAFGETTDDHQVESARRLEMAGLATVSSTEALATSLVRDESVGRPPIAWASPLESDLRRYVTMVVAAEQTG